MQFGQLKRRKFITLLGGAAAAWPMAVRAQISSVPRVGILMNLVATETRAETYITAFVQELRQLGRIEGQNLRLDIRWSGGDAQLARIYAAQLIGLMPDAILAVSTTNLRAIQEATSTIPVVFTQVSDPVAQGFVANITKPGGHLTGFGLYEFSIGAKWLNLLKEIAPSLAHVGVMFNPDTSPQSKFFMRSIEAALPALHLQASAVPVRSTADIEPAMISLGRQPNCGLILPTDSFTQLRQSLISELAGRHRLPSISAVSSFPKDGGLMSYSSAVSATGQFRQAAGYVDRILKGAKPSDLPIQMADKFTFILNLKTAKALGLTVPPPLLGLADEVIE